MSDNKKRLKSLFVDTGAFALGSLGSKILTFLLVPLYTNVLSTSEYGIANFILTTVSVVYPISTIAISEGALRFAMDEKTDKKEVLTVTLLFNFMSIILLLISYSFIKMINESITVYWKYFFLYFCGMTLHDSLSQYIKGLGKTKLFAIQGVLHTAFLITCNLIFLLVLHMGLIGYLISTILGYFLTILFIIIAGRLYRYIQVPKIKKELCWEMIRYSAPMVPTIVAWWANSAIDKYIIVGLLGFGANGVYSVAGKIPAILSVATSLFSQAWQLSAIKSAKDSDFSQYFNKVYYSFFVVSSFAGIIFMSLNRVFCRILFAKEFYAAWVFVPCLIVANQFSAMSGMLASAFRAYKKTKTLFVSTIVGALVNLGLNILLIKVVGPLGAAIATMISFGVVLSIRSISVKRLVTVKLPLRKVCFTLCLLLLTVTVNTLDMPFIISFIVSIILIGILCMINSTEIRTILVLAKKLIQKSQGD